MRQAWTKLNANTMTNGAFNITKGSADLPLRYALWDLELNAKKAKAKQPIEAIGHFETFDQAKDRAERVTSLNARAQNPAPIMPMHQALTN